MARFGQRVLDESAMRFVRFRDIECGLRQHFDTQGFQQMADLPQLAGIVAGDDEFLHF